MPKGVYDRTSEKYLAYRKRQSERQKGKPAIKFTPEICAKISKSKTGKPRPDMRIRMTGRVVSEATKEKFRKLYSGKKLSPEHVEKIRKAVTGTKWKLESRLRNRGENHHSWRGGLSSRNYSEEFTNEFKTKIRVRDGRTCVLCFCSRGDFKLDVHHVDYDKKNCKEENLITLCHGCHMITNGNRTFWETYFKGNGVKLELYVLSDGRGVRN